MDARTYGNLHLHLSRVCILGRNWDKNLKTFAPFYLQSPPPADPRYGFLELENSTATDESGWRLGFAYVISLFTFESSIVLSLIKLYFYI